MFSLAFYMGDRQCGIQIAHFYEVLPYADADAALVCEMQETNLSVDMSATGA